MDAFIISFLAMVLVGMDGFTVGDYIVGPVLTVVGVLLWRTFKREAS